MLGATGAMALSELGLRAQGRKLNFIFILIDDLGWTDLGCFGSDLYETPNIDRLAQQGMKFTDVVGAEGQGREVARVRRTALSAAA